METADAINAAEGVTPAAIAWLKAEVPKRYRTLRFLAGQLGKGAANADVAYRRECQAIAVAYSGRNAADGAVTEEKHQEELVENPALDDYLVFEGSSLGVTVAITAQEPSRAIDGNVTMSHQTFLRWCRLFVEKGEAEARALITTARLMGGVLRSIDENSGASGQGVSDVAVEPPVRDLPAGGRARSVEARGGTPLLRCGSPSGDRSQGSVDQEPGRVRDPALPFVSPDASPGLPALGDGALDEGVRALGDRPAEVGERESLGEGRPSPVGLPAPAGGPGIVGDLTEAAA